MSSSEPQIPWSQLVKFVGQFNHDLRNHLNAVELQAAFLTEIITEEDAGEEMKRLREMTAAMGSDLQRLSGLLSKIQPTMMTYGAAELVEDLRSKVEAAHPDELQSLVWNSSLGAESVEIDPHVLLEALAELWENAFTHGRGSEPLVFNAEIRDRALVLTLREPKNAPLEVDETWAARPLAQVRHGHYSLGLFRARGIVAAHQGTFRASYDPTTSALVTTVTLPLSNN